ncbi:MAG: hypothetical protein ACFBSE_21070 [Prochloraceae cyanobacterium]
MNQETKMNVNHQIQINDLVNTQENNNLVDLSNSELEGIHGGTIATQAPQYLGLVQFGFVDANGDPTALGDHFLDLLDSGALPVGSIQYQQALQVQQVELLFS